jgi:hypothetical protein
MKASKRSDLMETIRSCVADFRDAGRRFWNKDIVAAVIERNSLLLGELGQQLAREKVFDLTRRVMKTAVEMSEEDAQLELGLKHDSFEMPGMIAVPVDADKPLNGECEWVPVTDATVADLDANLRMLDSQIAADQRKRRNIFLLRQRVVAVVGEDSPLTVAQAAAMARELQPA